MNGRRRINEMMNEVINYGGLPMRRCDVFTLASETWGCDYLAKGGRLFGPDYFAFRPEAIDAEPLSLERAREIVGEE